MTRPKLKAEPRFFIIGGGHATAEAFFDFIEAEHGIYVAATLHDPPVVHGSVYGIVEYIPHSEEEEEP
jgi:hypothetical protein